MKKAIKHWKWILAGLVLAALVGTGVVEIVTGVSELGTNASPDATLMSIAIFFGLLLGGSSR